jgi:hypothetical protein
MIIDVVVVLVVDLRVSLALLLYSRGARLQRR